MKWRLDFEEEERNQRPLPKTYPCKHCSDYGRVLLPRGFKGRGKSLKPFFRGWLSCLTARPLKG
jgi:hypothetical protein